ncbi:MAG: site-specific DNA-methyltransferase [Clostridia bacterium]|nr:site-specific DNA-methyltransferase [Clostridia bacterium]
MAQQIAYNCDCLEAMREMPDKAFDLAVVDPPYGIGMDGGNVGYKGFNVFTKKDWDKTIPEKEYFEQLFRVSKNQIIWGGNYYGLQPSRCWLIWDKGEGFYNRTYAEAELAWTSFDKNVKIFKRDPLANGDYHGKIHPTQKPVALYAWILRLYAKPGYKILDTHLGSGSSRIAAYDAGLDFVGYEIDKEYFGKQEERFQKHTAQFSLFV